MIKQNKTKQKKNTELCKLIRKDEDYKKKK